MKIRSVATRVEAFALTRPYTITFRSVDSAENVIVRIETDNGLFGLGAASPEPHVTGETAEACRAALSEQSLDWLAGRDARELPALCRELGRRMPEAPAARAAVDIALHDLFAKHLGLPLADVLGRAHESLPTSITIGIKPLAETLAEAEEYIGRGFRILKVKVGRSLEEDIERLARLREKVGPKVGIRADANQGYTRAETLRFFEATGALDLEFVEQPMKAGAVEELRSLPERVRRRIAADEALLDERDALALVAPPSAAGIFNIKLMKCGGAARAAHRGDRRGGGHRAHVGLHGRERHLDRRGAPRGACLSGHALPRPRRQPRPRPRRRRRRLRHLGRGVMRTTDARLASASGSPERDADCVYRMG